MKTTIRPTEFNRVLKTNDYSLFTYPSDIRFSQEKLKIIIGEIALKNLSPDLPIIVDSNYIILDGKYRFEASKALNLPIFYKVAEVGTRIDFMKAKSNSFTHSAYDYLMAHQDKLAYRMLSEWSKKSVYGFEDIGNLVFDNMPFEKKSIRNREYKKFINGELEWDSTYNAILEPVCEVSKHYVDSISYKFSISFLDNLLSSNEINYNPSRAIAFIDSIPFINVAISLHNAMNPNAPMLEDYIEQVIKLYKKGDFTNIYKTETKKTYYYGIEHLSTSPIYSSIYIVGKSNDVEISPNEFASINFISPVDMYF